ncbi:uncharacterized protein LOC127709652 [Mytilus californianus]|uniref:uncharacterized protein LOC127709652 n=1 Tax=Mytilus californianus TaxID=6549 RepID=UPI002246D8E6|nr:uncharacterized protein LOC127709652 [Mytilus californianus]
MKRITTRVQEIDRDNVETRGSYTCKSRFSHSSHSHRSSASQRSQTASRAADLKAKLKYIEIEAKAKLELERIQTIRELEATEAKLDVIDKASQGSDLDELKRSLPEANILDKFLQHVNPDAKVDTDIIENIKDEHDDFVTTLPRSTVPKKLNIDHDQVQPIHHISYKYPVQGHSVPTVSLQGQGQFVSNVDQSRQAKPTPKVRQLILDQSALNVSQSFVQSVSSVPVVTHTRSEPVVTNVKSAPVVTSVSSATLNPSAITFLPQNVNTANVTGQYVQIEDLTKSLAEQVSLSRLPPPEPSVFFGDPLKYPAWKSSFQTLIEQRKIPTFERIHYLRKYVGDSVREVIENFLVLSTEDAYDDAKELLEKRYGDPFIISNAFRDRLDNWPKVLSRDNIALRKFSDFLKQCLSAMKTMGTLNALNDNRENRKLLSKLPDWVVTRWSRIVAKHKEDKREFPSFQTFVDFVEKEAIIANDPVTSIQSVRSETTNSTSDKFKTNRFQRGKYDNQRRNVLATETSRVPDKNHNSYNKDQTCTFCKKTGHFINSCYQFLGKSVNERKNFAKEKGLCFGCLGYGHTSKKCQKRKKCEVCSRFHPTSLHGDFQKPIISVNKDKPFETGTVENCKSQTGAVFMNNTKASCKSSMIVPVYVSHSDDPENERLVYALLDTQSDTTFVLDETRRALGLSGTDVKLSLSTMHAENHIVDSRKIKGLMVRGFDSEVKIPLPNVFTRDIMPANRSHIPTAEMTRRWSYLEHLAGKLMPVRDCEFGLLIGYNCPRALIPREVIPSIDNGPYGQKTDLGWGIVGIVDPLQIDNCDSIGFSHRTLALEVPNELSIRGNKSGDLEHVYFSFGSSVKEIIPSEVARMMELDFSDRNIDKISFSFDDKRFISILNEGISVENGHYVMPLPFKDKNPPILPNNKNIAVTRLNQLKGRLQRDKTYRNHYFTSMNDFIEKGYVEKVESSEQDIDGHVWYIPHHGVYHPQKPDKVRVVFDCSARYQDHSLNDHLLQGPDLTNTLIGVLCRFRKEQIAVICDIEQMFLQFNVNKDHRDYLRFLWWKDDNLHGDPIEYRMNVHLFGAASSPGCANFGLKRVADDYEDEFGSDISDFLRNDFYVDDGLKSVASVDDAVSLVKRSQDMCNKGGLRLHKFQSNSKDVLNQILIEDRAKDLKNLDLLNDKLPITKALGIQWCIESDSFQFRIELTNKPLTRRGILSTLSSVYDPLGFLSPFVLLGKQILQECCSDQIDWDEPPSETLIQRWQQWRNDIQNLAQLGIQRCVKPKDFGNITVCELHHFSDASTLGYGQCSYLRLIDENELIHCTLLMGKARVTPRRSLTIPRLELSAALVSVRISQLLKQELRYENVTEWFWTDSNIVLGYIANDNRRFHVFVANRVQQIREHSSPTQWKYVDTKENPADVASRGASANDLVTNSNWFTGPKFLWTLQSFDADANKPDLTLNDPEIRMVKAFSTKMDVIEFASLIERLEYFSNWNHAKRAVSICLKLKDTLRSQNKSKNNSPESKLCVNDMQRAEIEIIKQLQASSFNEEIVVLQSIGVGKTYEDRHSTRIRNVKLKQTSSLYKLDPFLDSDGIIRVGGRIRRAEYNLAVKHPVIIPRHSHVTELIIRHFHEKAEHQGRGMKHLKYVRTDFG